MKSRAKSKLYSCTPHEITAASVRQALIRYGYDARIALLFLKNINSINCYERHVSGGLSKLWGVTKTLFKKTGFCGLKVSHEKLELLANSAIQRTTGSDNWLLFTSALDAGSIPGHLQATQRRHKLQARCGIAARMVPNQEISPKGRLFLDVPTANTLDLPVHISAVSISRLYRELAAFLLTL
jgi:hypothetical protein